MRIGGGAARRYFRLTPAGRALLAGFIERNLMVFQLPQAIERLRRVLNQSNRKAEEKYGN